MTRWLLIHCFLYVFFEESFSCTDFLLNTSLHDTVISARTMDYSVDLQTNVEVIPQRTIFHDLPVYKCPNCPDVQWTNTYGFVAFNMFGINVASDGLNEKGLSAAWLYLYATRYPSVRMEERSAVWSHMPNGTRAIIASLCSYLLGTFASVRDVRAGLSDIKIAEFDVRIQNVLFHSKKLERVPLHISVHDAERETVVIEFIAGKMVLYNHLNEVLTNDPPLDEQIALEEEHLHEDNTLPGGYDSIARYQRVFTLNQLVWDGYTLLSNASYLQGTIEQNAISMAYHIVNTVVLPPTRSKSATQWTVVRDHKRRKVYFQSTQNQVPRLVDLNAIDFTNSTNRRMIPITSGEWYQNVTSLLQDPSSSAHTLDIPARSRVESALNDSTSFQNVDHSSKSALFSVQFLIASFCVGGALGSLCTFALLRVSRRAMYIPIA
uniref:Cysteine protease family C59 putative n=1 Tax=Albugo laibachii Nc14 TaxID=890382 RepID=F0WY32_9STRA|nr:cysteine protease family C59 putative [Albugo laibachii Nc14]|eukprot:CCA26381.1 cysteine protease family C59 putative [Albugo laibachii Nc14]